MLACLSMEEGSDEWSIKARKRQVGIKRIERR
jgi:hypothetical protein